VRAATEALRGGLHTAVRMRGAGVLPTAGARGASLPPYMREGTWHFTQETMLWPLLWQTPIG
jgi:hypothetical protein